MVIKNLYDLIQPIIVFRSLDAEEVNILYVALTRTKHQIVLNGSLLNLLRHYGGEMHKSRSVIRLQNVDLK